MFEFVYRDPKKIRYDALSQGDVIARTPDVVAAVGQAHQYYASAPLYTHFVVITQSCDLVRRRNEFNAPYITIAVAKPFKATVDDYFSSRRRSLSGAQFSYLSRGEKDKGEKLLERFLNNTESEYFFLPKDGHENLSEDLLVYLRLSIALRKEHYDVLAGAKVAELDDIFQAKLGWLKGNIYARIATPDFAERETNPKDIKDAFFDAYIPSEDTVWLSVIQADRLREIVTRRRKDKGQDLTAEEVVDIIDSQIPTDLEILADNIVQRLIRNMVVPAEDQDKIKRARNSVLNEAALKSLLSRAG